MFAALAVIPAPAQPQRCLEVPSGLVAWLPGDGDAGDIEGTNDGTLVNGATFVSGQVDQAFTFDGVDDFVEVPDASALEPSVVTVDAWIRGQVFGGLADYIVSKGANECRCASYAAPGSNRSRTADWPDSGS